MPALNKAREQAKAVMCLTNLHQLGLATLMYAEQNDDYIPHGICDPSIPNFYDLLLPFMNLASNDGNYQRLDIFRCLSYPDKAAEICYVINDWKFTEGADGYFCEPDKISTLRNLSDIVYLADSESGEHRPSVITSDNDADDFRLDIFSSSHLPSSDNVTSEGSGRRVAKARHRNGHNALYLDWHTDWVSGDLDELEYLRMWRSR